ncbi:MFS transporter [Dongia soli]|uniref:MFS transporter n=1 Tax=Dongia soli TaxID=600628 RepID=A0ABU5EC46_9PROT|nr:MFS transporter [Dongia soli]MDY0883115.1 MFS transporter [Dongia soli]
MKISFPKSSSFLRFWMSQTASTMAYQMLVVAIGWQVYDLTQSAFMLGMVGLVQFVPQLLLTLIVGHVADQYDRRRIVLLCQWLKTAMAAILAIGSLTGTLTVEIIFICACLIGGARAFELPSMQALLPKLVEPSMLARAMASAAGGREFAIIIGPALGGLIYALGSDIVYMTGAALFLAAGFLVLIIRLPFHTQRREKPTLQSLLGGVNFIRSKKVVLGAISMDLFSVLLGGATALLPIYARDILQTGPWGLGLLRTAPAIGALAMSVYLAKRPLASRVGHVMFAAVAGFGLATIVFGISRWFPLSLLALIVLGAMDMVSVVIRQTLVQLETPDEMRGRVSAVNAIFIGASNQLGEFESGVTAAWFGTVPAVVIGGIGTLLVVVAWMRLFPDLFRRDALLHEQPRVTSAVPEKSRSIPSAAP